MLSSAKVWISSLLLLVSVSLTAQVTAPSLRCISVDGNQIKLDWVISNDPLGQFTGYNIFLSIGGLPFTPINNINNRLQNSFTHVSAQFGIVGTDYRYFIVATYNDGTPKQTATSDTLRPITPTLVTTGNKSGTLTWNNIKTPALTTSAARYNVDRRFDNPAPTWSNGIGSPLLGQELHKDSVARCDDNVYYKVRLADDSGCESVSAIATAPLKKTTGPARLTFNQVSVDRDFGHVELTWDKPNDGSVVGFIIIYVDANGVETFIDTVSSNTLSYKDLNVNRNAHGAPQCYKIAALDSCGLTQGALEKHCTMHMTRTFDPCEGEVYLSWTPYIGWGAVGKYEVYISLNNGPYSKKGEVSGTDTVFIVRDVSALNTYGFYIRALHSSLPHTSISNVLGTKFNVPDRTKFLKLRSASVQSESEVKLSVYVDRKAPIKGIQIYRSHNLDGPYKKIATYPPPGTRDTLFGLLDTNCLPDQLDYFYYAVAIDRCNKPIKRSNTVRTIFLHGESKKYDFTNFLHWESQLVKDSLLKLSPASYLHYGLGEDLGLNPVFESRSFFEAEHQFTDEVDFGNKFCYQIKLVIDPTLIFPSPDTSYSNKLCFKYEPDAFIPNAFSPNNDGVNEVWKPEVNFVETEGHYLLRIFNRWGKVIFETTDPNVGWSGTTDSGNPVGVGNYNFYLKIVSHRGSTFEQRGIFTLIR